MPSDTGHLRQWPYLLTKCSSIFMMFHRIALKSCAHLMCSSSSVLFFSVLFFSVVSCEKRYSLRFPVPAPDWPGACRGRQSSLVSRCPYKRQMLRIFQIVFSSDWKQRKQQQQRCCAEATVVFDQQSGIARFDHQFPYGRPVLALPNATKGCTGVFAAKDGVELFRSRGIGEPAAI